MKKIVGIKLGEYREFNHKYDYSDNKLTHTYNKNHFFEFSASLGYGASFKYYIGESRFESFGLSVFGFSVEYSMQSGYYTNQLYIGLDTGISGGIGLGYGGNIKAGWKFNF